MKKTPQAEDVVLKLFSLLQPLPQEARSKAIKAAQVLLGEPSNDSTDKINPQVDGGSITDVPKSVIVWMKQHSITKDEIDQIFHFDEGKVELIISEIPGDSDKEKTVNAYVLEGLRKLFEDGIGQFDEKSVKELCKQHGCFNSTNHATYSKGVGNRIAGTKTGMKLTGPGKTAAANLIKVFSKPD